MEDSASLTQPLTEVEIQQLDDFLGSDSAPEDAMDISMMDGFITALASGPNLMMPSSMLRWIWDAERGVEEPTFPNAALAQRIVGLIIRHWNSVNDMHEPCDRRVRAACLRARCERKNGFDYRRMVYRIPHGLRC